MKLDSGSHETTDREWGVIAAELERRIPTATAKRAAIFRFEADRILSRHPAARETYERARNAA